MATKSMNVNAYLFFDGQCEAAFTFYEQAQGGPADWADKILRARLELGGTVVMASDAPPGHYDRPQGFRVSLTLEDAVDAERIFHALEEKPWMIGCEPQR